MKTKIQLLTYTERLAAISLLTLFMASSVAAESTDTDRHKRSTTVASRQQQSASHRASDNHRPTRRVRGVKRVSREDITVNRSNQQRVRNDRNVTTARNSSDRRNLRQTHNNNPVTQRDNTSNTRSFRRHSDRDRHEGREQHRDYAYRSGRNHGFLTIFNYRPYTYRRVNRYIPLTYHGLNYFYNGGAYYRYSGFGFTLVNNNIGIFLYSLPFGYRTLTIGGYPYYYVNRHYYIRDYVRKVYVQVDDPYQAEDWDDADNDTSTYRELFIYPKQGQTEPQMKQDEYECYLWAVEQTGFDPSLSNDGNIEDYLRAKGACLEGRGYVVN